MRHFLISALFLSFVAGCSNVNIGPHRIDVQQGNALDQENVSRLKPGLSRSQVRFLLGTPLVVDPFRTDRWDYVYVYYKAGKLAEQKHVSLFFEGETLVRIEGDVPAVEPASPSSAPTVQTESRAETPALAPDPTAQPSRIAQPAEASVTTVPVMAAPAPLTGVAKPTAPSRPSAPAPSTKTSIVPPLPSPKDAPTYVDPRPPAELSLRSENAVSRIQPDVIPPFPQPQPVTASSDDAVLKSVNDWASAWSRRDVDAYFAAYHGSFVPQGGGSRAEWEKRRRLLLGVAKNIEVKIDSPSVNRANDGSVSVTFNQSYRSERFSDAVVKQLRMVERNGRWLIVEEKVLSILRAPKS